MHSAILFKLLLMLVVAFPASIMSWPGKALSAENAIARLNYAGFRKRGHCTASLIGQSTLLTARHCIEGPSKRDLRVVFGYDRGEWVELRKVKSVHPDEKRDIAVLCLDKPSQQKPIKLGDVSALPLQSEASVTGYRRSKAHATSTLICQFQKGKTRARMECPVEPGMSGSPVRINGKIVAVMASTTKAFSIATLAKDIPKTSCE